MAEKLPYIGKIGLRSFRLNLERRLKMIGKSGLRLAMILSLLLTAGTIASAQSQKQPRLKDQIDQSDKAAQDFRQIMKTPDKGIHQAVLNKAECVAVFPSMLSCGPFLRCSSVIHGAKSRHKV
jgi:hypothetical protein